jgi:DNA-binding transcriptional LysR family regulator
MNNRLNQLSLFARTVETGSFSRTAREFGLSQPSVSRAVAALEARLGVTLLHRTTRRMTTTDAGHALALSAREALAALDDAESAARGADRLSGILRVSLPTGFGVRQVIPHLPGFLALQPELRVELMMSDRFDDLVVEGADLALRLGAQPDSAFLTRKLASSERLVVAAPEYLARRGVPTSLAELAAHDCIGGPGDADRTVWTFRRAGKPESASIEVRLRTRSGAGVAACAAAGLGIALASRWMCGDELRDGRLRQILPDCALDPVDAYVVFSSAQRPSRKARAFSDYLARALNARPAATPQTRGA